MLQALLGLLLLRHLAVAVNMRPPSPISLSAPMLLPSSSETVDNGISQVHLAYGRRPSQEMSVAWASNFSVPLAVSYLSTATLDAAAVAQAEAQGIAGKGGGVQVSTPSDFTQYSIDDSPWGFPAIYNSPVYDDPPTFNSTFANYTSPFIHNATFKGLEPDTKYLYQIGGYPTIFNFTSGLSPGSFPTATSTTKEEEEANADPASGFSLSTAQQQPFVVSVVGDLGQTADSVITLNHMIADPHSRFTMIAGDVSYSDCDQTRWDSSGAMLQPLTSHQPLMVGPGNHEVEYYPKSRQSFQAFEARFFMPDAGPPIGMTGGAHFKQPTGENDGGDDEDDGDDGSNEGASCTPSKYTGNYAFGNAFWSVDVGPLHVVSLNCYGPTALESDQYLWLEADLSAVDRTVTPFVLMQSHCPFYSTNKNHFQEWQALDMQETFEPLMFKYGVDLMLSGHVHAYQRSHPVYQNKAVPGAPVYVVVGEGGNREGHAKGYVTPTPEWSAYTNDTSFGHGTVTVHNKTHMQWQWHVNSEPSWETQDSAWFVRPEAAATDDSPPSPSPPPPGVTDDGGGSGSKHENKHGVSTGSTATTVACFSLGVLVLLGVLAMVARRTNKSVSAAGGNSREGTLGSAQDDKGDDKEAVNNPIYQPLPAQRHGGAGGGYDADDDGSAGRGLLSKRLLSNDGNN